MNNLKKKATLTGLLLLSFASSFLLVLLSVAHSRVAAAQTAMSRGTNIVRDTLLIILKVFNKSLAI